MALKILLRALADVVQWTEHQPVNQRRQSNSQSRAHAWVAGQVPSCGRARGNHTLMFLSLSPSHPLSLNINKILRQIFVKRAVLVLNVLTTKTQKMKTPKGHGETFGSDGYVLSMDRGEGNTVECVCPYINYVQFFVQLYLKKTRGKKQPPCRFCTGFPQISRA